jgi:HSP20 family protein
MEQPMEVNPMKLVPYFRKSHSPARLWPDSTRILEDFFNDFLEPATATAESENWTPAVDILEKNGTLILRAELPGLEEKEIDVKLEGDVLTFKGERKREKEEKGSSYHRIESFHGSFSRSFSLPDTVDRDKITAEYKNGLLTIAMPLRTEVKPREIPVSVH